jgi:hypothetical protein
VNGGWHDARLERIYRAAERVAEALPEDSVEEDCVRLAMSKLDEADMIIARTVSA